MNETIKSLELQDDENPDKQILLIGGFSCSWSVAPCNRSIWE